MAVLKPNVPVPTPEPVLLVENKLAIGTHRFRLVHDDEAGVESDPVERDVVVTD
jgi:hypothetical protein